MQNNRIDTIDALLHRLLVGPNLSQPILVGFDGYEDTIVKPLKQYEKDEPRYFETIAEFASYLLTKAEKSCSIQLHHQQSRAGGNMPLYSQALSALGMQVYGVGAFGWPKPEAVFQNLGKGVYLDTVCEPGRNISLEFNDGKILLNQNGAIDHLDYETLRSRLGKDVLSHRFAEADVCAFMNWSELPGATSIWRGILGEILPAMNWVQRRFMVTDISDCSHRSPEEIGEILELMNQYGKWYSLLLSVNQNEAGTLATALGIPWEGIHQLGSRLMEKLPVDRLVIHLLDGAWGYDKDGDYHAPGVRIEKPTITTGGGDHFNAGLTYGLMCGLNLRLAMLAGNLTSSCYVTSAVSPTPKQLCERLQQYEVKIWGQYQVGGNHEKKSENTD